MSFTACGSVLVCRQSLVDLFSCSGEVCISHAYSEAAHGPLRTSLPQSEHSDFPAGKTPLVFD